MIRRTAEKSEVRALKRKITPGSMRAARKKDSWLLTAYITASPRSGSSRDRWPSEVTPSATRENESRPSLSRTSTVKSVRAMTSFTSSMITTIAGTEDPCVPATLISKDSPPWATTRLQKTPHRVAVITETNAQTSIFTRPQSQKKKLTFFFFFFLFFLFF
jgi:hypothetical protein